MSEWSFTASNERDTERLAAALADCLPERAVIGLIGTLGAGKTLFVRAFAERCGVDPLEVTSPTFTLCSEHTANRRIYHLDAYRVKTDAEFLDLGVEEMFAEAAITLIEWSDRVADCLPEDRLDMEITVCGECERQFAFSASGSALCAALSKLEETLA